MRPVRGLVVLAGGAEEPFIAAVSTLAGQGDHALALDLAEAGLACHPASPALARSRQGVLQRLMDGDQLIAPFRYVVYAELAGTEMGPVR